MAYDLQSFRRILAEYEHIRINNEALRAKRIKEVYDKIPRVEEIDTQINQLGFSQTQKIIQNPLLAKQYKQEFKSALSVLEKEREELLIAGGFKLDYMDIEYQCDICEDTGYVKNKKCRCFEQKLINAAYANSNLDKILNEQNFSTFSFDYYSRNVSEDNISPFERISDIFNVVVEFVKNFETYEKSLLFYGASGLGKTFLSSCVAKELLDNGKTVIYTRATRLFSLYEDYKFNRVDAESAREQLDKLFEVDLLIIDDLGTEQITKTSLAFLFDILTTRLADGKKMIISTNHSMNELSSIYSTRFTSRIYEYFKPLKFLGDDIRVKKCLADAMHSQ